MVVVKICCTIAIVDCSCVIVRHHWLVRVVMMMVVMVMWWDGVGVNKSTGSYDVRCWSRQNHGGAGAAGVLEEAVSRRLPREGRCGGFTVLAQPPAPNHRVVNVPGNEREHCASLHHSHGTGAPLNQLYMENGWYYNGMKYIMCSRTVSAALVLCTLVQHSL